MGLRSPAWRRKKPRNRPSATAARSASTLGSGITTTAARRHLRCVWQFGEKFAARRIVFANVARPADSVPDVDESFAVYRHAVPLRRIERTDNLAALVDVDH